MVVRKIYLGAKEKTLFTTLSDNRMLMGHVLRHQQKGSFYTSLIAFFIFLVFFYFRFFFELFLFSGIRQEHRLAEVRVPRNAYNDHLKMFFKEHQDFWAHDRHNLSKVGDWVLIEQTDTPIHKGCFVSFSLGNALKRP